MLDEAARGFKEVTQWLLTEVSHHYIHTCIPRADSQETSKSSAAVVPLTAPRWVPLSSQRCRIAPRCL